MASGGDMPFLPFEIIINILERLPLKSIVRFQCVCKEWKNLFKTPSFIDEHLDHSDRKNPFLLLHEYSYDCRSDHNKHWRSSLHLVDYKMETIEVLSIPSIGSFRRRWEIIGSCNGLLCVQVYHGRSPGSLWLWNPVIREVREVANSPHDQRNCKVGFGFSSVVNDYKIVRFYSEDLPKNEVDRLYHHTEIVGVEVYSLSTGSWKELEFGALHLPAFLSKAVNVDGTIFCWITLS
ncbi:hypothetical protein K1719_028418 [Acacia pycnantha]|nr:hypothetical protein K1719_028418 [Acacia pycnantha]